jgi:hypothetical protein
LLRMNLLRIELIVGILDLLSRINVLLEL